MSIHKYDGAAFDRDRYYTIGDLSKLYHIGADTLRYYEEKGVLTPVRGENGYRYYDMQNIWRMNVIMNLRSLDFPVERIGDYLENRTVASTRALLAEELGTIDAKLRELRAMQKVVREQLEALETAQTLELEKVRILERLPRRAIEIKEKHSTDEDMDVLMKRLAQESGDKLYIIGNNRMASIVADDMDGPIYDGALLFDKAGEVTIPGGTYLSICYSGPTESRRHVQALREYAAGHAITLYPPFLDVVWIDIHTTSDRKEFISEVQVRAEF